METNKQKTAGSCSCQDEDMYDPTAESCTCGGSGADTCTCNEGAAEPCACGCKADMTTLMERCPITACMAPWIKCMRTPAISVKYTMSKQHIPDLDAQGGGLAATHPDGGREGGACGDGCSCTPAGKTQNGAVGATDIMTCRGGFTIRYFDLAMGAMGLLLAGCLFKWLRRM